VNLLADSAPQALKDCDNALRLNPADAAALANRGFVHLRLERFDLAITDYDAALRLRPNFVKALYGRGLAKLKMGDDRGASQDIEAAKLVSARAVSQLARSGFVQ
jgi:tetratricopeptide (TPR) repeat protein